jgi:hypothetical protein
MDKARLVLPAQGLPRLEVRGLATAGYGAARVCDGDSPMTCLYIWEKRPR